jgi:hypothetical protein
MLELEKQKIQRRSAEIETALSEIMWKGSTTVSTETKSTHNEMIIIVPDMKSKLDSESVYSTKYDDLADSSVVDYMEKKRVTPVLPVYLRPNTSSDMNTVSTTASRSISTSPLHCRDGRSCTSSINNDNNSFVSARALMTLRKTTKPLGKIKSLSHTAPATLNLSKTPNNRDRFELSPINDGNTGNEMSFE